MFLFGKPCRALLTCQELHTMHAEFQGAARAPAVCQHEAREAVLVEEVRWSCSAAHAHAADIGDAHWQRAKVALSPFLVAVLC